MSTEEIILHPADDYHEDYGFVLWFRFPSFEEPPDVNVAMGYIDSSWNSSYTHFAKLNFNDIFAQAKAL